jgi:ParB family chromosome partitioning protein
MAAQETMKGPRILESLDIPPWQIANTSYDSRVTRDPGKQARLKESMRAVGILVRLMVVREGDHFRVVDGQSRLDAAKDLQLATVPVDVIAADDADSILKGIIANNVREGNTAYEIMTAALKLVQEKNLGAGAIARTLGVSEGYVKDLLAISGLPEPLLGMLHSGDLSAPAAKELLRITVPEEQMIVGRDFAERRTSGRQAESIVSSYILYREKQKNLPPVTAAEMAQHDPLFTCELCGDNKPIRGSQGKVYCGDCNRELMYLWEQARRERKEQQAPMDRQERSYYDRDPNRPDIQLSYTIGEPPKEHTTEPQTATP